MAAKLCLFECHNFRQEVAAAIAAEGWPDVVTISFPARCGRPPLSWKELRALLPEDCTEVIVLGRACLAGMGSPPADFPPVRLLPQEQCFHVVADANLVDEAIADNGYLITPGWLADWRGHLAEMGFAAESACEFFKNFARELILFDTDVDPAAKLHLAELAKTAGLPARRIAVGLDHTRLTLARTVLEWRLDDERRGRQEQDRRHTRELADYVSAMDQLGRLVDTQQEAEAITAIEDLFRMLFAPAMCHYLRAENGQPIFDRDIPADLQVALQRLESPYAWTPSGQGFLLRIARGDQLLGLMVVDLLTFPNYRERYLNLALTMTGVCALTIEEARTKAKLKQYQGDLEELLEERTTALHIAKKTAEAANRARRQLAERELELRTIIETEPECVKQLAEDGTLLHMNRAGLNMIEADSLDQILGQKIQQLVMPEYREAFMALTKRVFAGESGNLVFEVQGLRGGHRWLETHAAPLRNSQEQITALLGITRDVSERKRYEAKQEEATRQLESQLAEISELQTRLQEQVIRDPLTGLYNRRYLNETLPRELSRAKRDGYSLALIMIDLDHFKQVNDTYGHAAGDEVLKHLSSILGEGAREGDIICRYGGEEFLVALPGMSPDLARRRMEKWRLEFSEKSVRIGDLIVSVTLSAGIAGFPDHGMDLDTLLLHADEALYRSKNAGRNRVRCFESSK